MSAHELLGGLATLLGVGSCSIYLWQILLRQIKPHIFSWFIWGVVGLIGFAAQYAAHAGPGAWTVGVSSIFCLIITVAGLFYGEKSITRSDWACLIFALTAIPAWMATRNPLWAVVIVSAIDATGFYPTFRKSWIKPREESVPTFVLYTFQMFFALTALDTVNVTTALYPATIFVLNMALVFTLLNRRRALT